MMTRLPVALIAGPVGVLHAANEIPRSRPNKEMMRGPLVRVICRAMPAKSCVKLVIDICADSVHTTVLGHFAD